MSSILCSPLRLLSRLGKANKQCREISLFLFLSELNGNLSLNSTYHSLNKAILNLIMISPHGPNAQSYHYGFL